MKRERGVFRSLAKSAKERLSGEFWHEVREARVAELEKAQQGGRSGTEVLNQFITQVKSKVIRARESDPVEEKLYAKVREVLQHSVGGNPLAAVLDRDYMRELGDLERERYVLVLSEKVKVFLERLNRKKHLRFEWEKSFALLRSQ